jgi:hypothetical protein
MSLEFVAIVSGVGLAIFVVRWFRRASLILEQLLEEVAPPRERIVELPSGRKLHLYQYDDAWTLAVKSEIDSLPETWER